MGKRKTVEQLESELGLAKARKTFNAAKDAHRKVMEKLKK